MVILKALKPIFYGGRIVEVDNTFSCSLEHAKKLIASESATLVEKENKEPDDVKKQLAKMNKEKLLELAEELEIEGLNDSNKKDDIIEAILAKQGE